MYLVATWVGYDCEYPKIAKPSKEGEIDYIEAGTNISRILTQSNSEIYNPVIQNEGGIADGKIA